ncbi:MAG: hypothetical protein ABFS10_14415 [Bacteroidota bacterium]
MRLLSRSIEDKKLVWFEATNRYVVMEEPAYEVFLKLKGSISNQSIAAWFSKAYDITTAEATSFINEIQQFIDANRKPVALSRPAIYPDSNQVPAAIDCYAVKQYRFSGSDFCFHYQHQRIERMIHPLLAHLECKYTGEACHQFHMFRLEDTICLQTNGAFIGRWGADETHLFKGKVFLELLNRANKKEEREWMAVLHASAVTDGDSSIIITGRSGRGKSTALSLLLAHGFGFIADDFVPLEAASGKIFPFPIAISVKEGSVEILEERFPELRHAQLFHYRAAGKRVRYLTPPSNARDNNSVAVKAIVFVNYQPGAQLELREIPQHNAIQELVTESWVSKQYENAERFLDWFLSLPCYQLTYSDNDQMIAVIQNLFRDAK